AVFITVMGCKPSRSDVFVETVNEALIRQLLQNADSVKPLTPDSLTRKANPLFVTGDYIFSQAGKVATKIWYDELGKTTGFMEYQENKLKDSITFFPNGQRMMTLVFNNNGQPEGPARFYYPDGRVKLDGRYEKGIQTGIWREFAPDGRLLVAHEYDRYGNKKR
ncbi:MAG: hypothetical protein MUF24_10725, partial [Chitinophagaceae bacterium]|nr:hypothetical protein [Chitinophagaceae bacterium]